MVYRIALWSHGRERGPRASQSRLGVRDVKLAAIDSNTLQDLTETGE